ncbi:MAG: IS110 family transposase [Cellvibrionaceae bacterium]
MNNTIAGVDLAKDSIQVCVYRKSKVRSNVEMTPRQFTNWLVETQPCIIVFEACGTSNYWKQKATQYGHDARLISAKLVEAIRQNQKNDHNDALAIVQASLLPNVNFIVGKNITQQQLQSTMRLRDLGIKHKVAIGNQLEALLLEFNIRVSSRNGGLRGAVEASLEDAENVFSMDFRQAISAAWQQYEHLIETIEAYDSCLQKSIESNPDCSKLMKLEGVGFINAINLYNTLAYTETDNFAEGKDAAACIGVTPIQHSSGGKVKLGSIGKNTKNSLLRSQLITGAFTFVNSVSKKEPKTKKEAWLKSLIERKGKKCAAVALANKTVRTAFALIKNNTEYVAESI